MSQVVAVGKEDQPFVGRENEQKEYWDFLVGKSDAPWLLVISGLGGIGKSTLLNALYKQTLEQHALPDTFAILLNFDTSADTEPSLQTDSTPLDSSLQSSSLQLDTSLRTDPLLFLNELAHLLKPNCDAEQFDAFTETLQRGRTQLAQLKEQVEQTSQSFAREHGMQPPSDARQTIRFAELEVNRQMRESVTEAFYKQVDTFRPERLVIMLDTCELLNESGSWIFSQWLMNEFLPELHSRMWRKPSFVVMAGRIPPESEVIDEYDQQHIVLSMLEESAVDTYLEKMGLHNPALRHSVYKITHGHALCVAIIGQFYQNIGQEALQAIDTSVIQTQLQTEFDQNASIEFINERILNKLDVPFRDLTQFGVLLRTFTLPLLRTVFPDLLPESDAKAVFDQFIRYPYIESRGNYRYAFHELIREVLAKNTQKQDLARWRHYHKKALDYFSAGEASSRSMDWYYHNLAYEEVQGMSDWRKTVEEARDRGDTQRVSLLLQITDDVALNLTTLSRAECAYEWGRLSVDRRQPLDKALEKYEEALSLYQQVGDRLEEVRQGQANVLQAMGDVQQSKVQLDKALNSYQDSLTLLQRSEKRSIELEAQVLKKIGDVQQLRGNLGDLDSALENYKQALNLFRQVANNLQAAQVLKNMGDVELQRHQLLGDLEDLNAALENYEQALGLFRQTKHRSKEDEAKILEAVGDVYQLRYQLSADRRDLEVSKESYQQAFVLFSDDTNARRRVKEKVEGREQREEPAEEANMRRAMEEMQKPQSEQGALLESDRQVSGQPSLSGKDIRATLAISTAEALHGTSRMLTLPGGRRVTVVVPVGAYDGQIIRLEGQGDPSSSGGSRGALILTLAIHPTVLARNPNLQQPTAGYSQDTPLQSPYPNNPYTQSLYPPPYAGYAPGRNTQPPPSYPPPPPPPSVSTRLPAQLREHRIPQRRQGCRAILLIGLALVVIAACAGLFAVLRSHQVANNPAAATAIAPQNIYTQATSGTPAFNDPLSHQDSSNWDVGTSNGKDCAFIGGAYHVKSSSQPCFAQASNFSNFALQVQMTIIKGNSGGIIFRAHLGSTNTSFYFFSIGQDGSYVFGTTQIGSSSGTSKLVFSSQGNMNAAAAIKHGLNQTNLITIVARGSDIYLFVNKHYIDHISDSTLNSGKIGVFANATSPTTISFGSGNPTDVAFSNAQIWIF